MMTEAEIARVPPGGWYYRSDKNNPNIADEHGCVILSPGDVYVFTARVPNDNVARMIISSHNVCTISMLFKDATLNQAVRMDGEREFWMTSFRQASYGVTANATKH